MKKKGLFGVLLFLLAGCVATPPPPAMQNPAMLEVKAMEASFADAEVSRAIASQTPAVQLSNHQLSWRFKTKKGLSVSGNNLLNLTIKPALDDCISLTVNDPTASLKAAVSGPVLAMYISASHSINATLYLPKSTRYLKFNQLVSVNGVVDTQLLYLNINDCDQVLLNSNNWMLQRLYINNTSRVQLSSIKTPYLLAWIKNSGDVQVHGMMSLRELNVQDSGPVQFYWLNSPVLSLTLLGNSNVLLAGETAYANTQIADQSQLDAKYLRVHRLFVKTTDNATAQVAALDSLNASAANQSNIYYYYQPITLSRYNFDHGSVLYMGETVPSCLLPYCTPLARIVPG